MLANRMASPSLFVLFNARGGVFTQAWKRTRRRRALYSRLALVCIAPSLSPKELFQVHTEVEQDAGRERAVNGLRGEGLLLLELLGGGRGRSCIGSVGICA